MQDMLRAFVNDNRTDWDIKLPALELAYNSSINQSIGCTPFELDIGMKPRLPIDVVSEVRDKPNTALDQFMSNWEDTWALAHKHIKKAQIRQKAYADKSRREEGYVVGDLAWVRRDRGTLQDGIGAIEKLGPRNEGPYEVIELHGENNVTLKLNEGDGRHPKFHVSQLRPYCDRDLARFPQPDDAVLELDDESDAESESERSEDEASSVNDSVKINRPRRDRRRVDHGVFVSH
jgi:hypothetical protein